MPDTAFFDHLIDEFDVANLERIRPDPIGFDTQSDLAGTGQIVYDIRQDLVEFQTL
jgi:hypothetical protein